ncbi:MAG: rRNA pseudouridine synthase [Eubacterium sp.]|nr:rRNA pseudouridine synthase [Eubacterium sp.]
MERIDKIISNELNIARSDAKSLIRSGKVFVNGVCEKSSARKLDEERDILNVNGKEIKFRRFVYIMMNKPKGVISSTDGRKMNEKTVVDILPDDMKRKNLFPAGRLDKDTTGFVLITDDGEFAHKILSPKNHIPKTYIASLDKPFDESIKKAFEKGVTIGSDECLPAVLEAVNGDYKTAKVIIRQGMYHQIKRMFKSFGIEVMELKRIRMGKLSLDDTLSEGECRFLDEFELELIKSN